MAESGSRTVAVHRGPGPDGDADVRTLLLPPSLLLPLPDSLLDLADLFG